MVFFVLHLFSNIELVQNNAKLRSLETIKSSTTIQPEEPHYNEKFTTPPLNFKSAPFYSYFNCWLPNPFGCHLLHSIELPYLWGVAPRMSPTFLIDSLTDHLPAPSFETCNHGCCIRFTTSIPAFVKSFLVGMLPRPNYLSGFAKEQRFLVCCICSCVHHHYWNWTCSPSYRPSWPECKLPELLLMEQFLSIRWN